MPAGGYSGQALVVGVTDGAAATLPLPDRVLRLPRRRGPRHLATPGRRSPAGKSTSQPISAALRTIIESQKEIPARWWMPIAPSASSAPGTCTCQCDKSATISFAVSALSGLGIFRVAFTKNSCST